MSALEHLIEQQDLLGIFLFATFVAIVFIITLMQFSWHRIIAPGDCNWVQHFRRISMALLAAMLFWAWSYAQRAGWQPWPPMLGIIIALDLWLGVSVLSGLIRKSRDKTTNARATRENDGRRLVIRGL